jgi:hypothetical protein
MMKERFGLLDDRYGVNEAAPLGQQGDPVSVPPYR